MPEEIRFEVTELTSIFIHDTPVSDFSIDNFGYKPLAKQVAQGIVSLAPNIIMLLLLMANGVVESHL